METAFSAIDGGNIEFVRFEQADINGISRSKIVPARHFARKAIEGVKVDSSNFVLDPKDERVHGTRYLDDKHDDDVILFPDFGTFLVLPWYPRTARVLTDSTWKGESTPTSPRHVAKQQLDCLQEMGYTLLSSFAYEFQLVNKETKQPITTDMMAGATLRNHVNTNFIYEIMRGLHAVGLDVESVESKILPGQLAMPIRPSSGISGADNGFTFKTAIKEIAQLNGYIASFMTSPYTNTKGHPECVDFNACHFNHSLWSKRRNKSVLFDDENRYKLTKIGESWLAGILEHSPAISCFAASTVNCREQYSDDVSASWDFGKRTSLIHVRVNGEKGTHFEYRLGGAAANPYLFLAAVVAAGIDGIKRELPLNQPPISEERNKSHGHSDDDAVTIPKKLEKALQALERDKTMVSFLGQDLIKHFVAVKRREITTGEIVDKHGEKDVKRRMYFEYI
ncbi:lengsin-like [Ptychodera flava]|uniref:lengsin-like n=1 Tax=Ptychodera flava TaxID=63121 RepID=UPI003969DD18